MAGRSTTRRLLFGLGSVVLALGLVELTLDALRLLSPTVRSLLGPPGASVPQVIPDERLGHRPNPEVPGRDERGFRNPAVPRRAPIVALGDSQTWGAGRAPYPATRDGHPNASGHHAIAASVAAVLERPTRRRAD